MNANRPACRTRSIGRTCHVMHAVLEMPARSVCPGISLNARCEPMRTRAPLCMRSRSFRGAFLYPRKNAQEKWACKTPEGLVYSRLLNRGFPNRKACKQMNNAFLRYSLLKENAVKRASAFQDLHFLLGSDSRFACNLAVERLWRMPSSLHVANRACSIVRPGPPPQRE